MGVIEVIIEEFSDETVSKFSGPHAAVLPNIVLYGTNRR
jgi:hypothetical protein